MKSEQEDKVVVSVSPEEGARNGAWIGESAGAVTTAQLRSRIEQQSSLIAMLKQRNDETFRELSHFKSLYEAIASENQELRNTLSQVNHNKSVLEQRFHTLSCNHDELTKIMEDYKTENKRLRLELDSRKSDGATELRDREKQLGVVTEEMKRKSTRVGVLEGRCRILEDEIGDLQKAEHIREEEHGKKLISQQQEQKVLADLLRSAEARLALLDEELLKLQKRNGELQLSLNTSVSLNKEKSSENEKLNSEIRKLLSEKASLAQEIEKIKVEWTRDAQISRLEKKLRDEQREKEKLQKAYMAYQKHSSELLREEKELTSKLRHFSDL